jgi:hypothetical protein
MQIVVSDRRLLLLVMGADLAPRSSATLTGRRSAGLLFLHDGKIADVAASLRLHVRAIPVHDVLQRARVHAACLPGAGGHTRACAGGIRAKVMSVGGIWANNTSAQRATVSEPHGYRSPLPYGEAS